MQIYRPEALASAPHLGYESHETIKQSNNPISSHIFPLLYILVVQKTLTLRCVITRADRHCCLTTNTPAYRSPMAFSATDSYSPLTLAFQVQTSMKQP